jgi:hypothetical protein
MREVKSPKLKEKQESGGADGTDLRASPFLKQDHEILQRCGSALARVGGITVALSSGFMAARGAIAAATAGRFPAASLLFSAVYWPCVFLFFLS